MEQENTEENAMEIRNDDQKIIEGARQTDQLEGLQENAGETGNETDEKIPNPSVVHVNNGENDHAALHTRGSGYTYDEANKPTDTAEPIDNEGDKIVKLPDLGEPNRP